jgi:hypothetical protein
MSTDRNLKVNPGLATGYGLTAAGTGLGLTLGPKATLKEQLLKAYEKHYRGLGSLTDLEIKRRLKARVGALKHSRFNPEVLKHIRNTLGAHLAVGGALGTIGGVAGGRLLGSKKDTRNAVLGSILGMAGGTSITNSKIMTNHRIRAYIEELIKRSR